MTPYRRPFIFSLGLLVGLLPAAQAAEKARPIDFSTKPIRLIIPFPPGASNDVLGRYVRAELTERVGEQVVVDNRGGELFKKVAGNIPVMFTSVTQALNHVRGGRIKMRAVGASKRSAAVPDVPTVAETGYPGYEVYVWWGLVSPHGMPRARLDKLRREINAVLEDSDTRKRLAADAAEPQIITPAEFRKMVKSDVKKWREVASQANIKVN